jgi:hypothetical protein
MSDLLDLLAWSKGIAIPTHSAGKPKRVRFDARNAPPFSECRTGAITAEFGTRRISGDAISIDSARLTGDRVAYRALALGLISFALLEHEAPLRIHLTQGGGIAQIVLWPGAASEVERRLGCRYGIREVHYRPALPEGNPNYTTIEQDEPEYPREHLPYFGIGAPGDPRGGVLRAEDAVCLHLAGTALSHVWLAKWLLNLSLDDSNCRLSYLYNYNPAESLAPGSAELRLVVSDASVEG